MLHAWEKIQQIKHYNKDDAFERPSPEVCVHKQALTFQYKVKSSTIKQNHSLFYTHTHRFCLTELIKSKHIDR